jgi:hypothetical protein
MALMAKIRVFHYQNGIDKINHSYILSATEKDEKCLCVLMWKNP